ncbi:threonine-phosphate decarboxylase CobD [Zongyangia hominis]|uniref:threonine-phosphate decarboxylase n=1 Tax=Zongyangia hominis TaxID=2763677 RepID=A0A926EA77_9FIRM|nr:threonine-phosphate decarboxylase CobD [Zongyangia hominis]MBC8569303.1 threonine-phosphate decarboxylase [Zongyangia hominis]
MEKLVHGGDIYAARQEYAGEILDFSANINPLGVPKGVLLAAREAVGECAHYPDPLCRELREALSQALGVPEDWILCGNGAADLIFRLALAVRPKRALTLAPTFAEYAQALSLVDCQVRFHPLRREEGFVLTSSFLEKLTSDLDLVVLCNPNNPTGEVIAPKLLEEIVGTCAKRGITLLLDECFVDFLDEPERHTLLEKLREYPGLLLLRAFTKLYAMAGLRLGYTLCSDTALLEKMSRCAQPWSVSIPAQAAGMAALREREYVARSRALIREERAFLKEGLQALGCEVFGSKANFVFFQTPCPDLCGRLRKRGILLRGCGNYPGLDDSYYRAAVRTREENERLLAALREEMRL